MRKIKHLSPTSINKWIYSQEEFYQIYLSDNIPPDIQTQPMAIGAGFDAYVKSYLYNSLYDDKDPRFDLVQLFNTQVSEENRAWAWKHSEYVFEQYRQSGALFDLLLELKKGSKARFEFELYGVQHGYREGETQEIGSVVLKGKPDLSFTNESNHPIIMDFKVNGYCSKYPKSPAPGYVKLRGAGNSIGTMHKDCMPKFYNGTTINCAKYIEDVDEDWARQLIIYSWLLGNPIGGDYVIGIDQIVCAPNDVGLPKIRVAEHRYLSSPEFQVKTFNKILEIWDIVNSDHIFRHLSKEDSQSRCRLLDQMPIERVR